MKNIKEEKAHAKYSPSAAYRWLVGKCYLSPSLEAKAGPQPEHETAKEGTHAHSLHELYLNKYVELKRPTSIFRIQGDWPVDMRSYVLKSAVKIIEKHKQYTNADLIVEKKVRLPHIHEELSGTLDNAIVPYGPRFHMTDYKHGKTQVEAEDNPQLKIYSLGLLHEYYEDFKEVEMNINQPRAQDRSSVITVKKLLKFEDELKFAIDECEKPKPKANATHDNCWFCKGKKLCPAYKKFNGNKYKNEFN